MSVSFKGVTLSYAKSRTDPLEREVKETGYPGVDGLQWMNLGARGRMFVIRGMSPGGSPSKSALDGMNDGTTGTLSVNGTGYTDVLCLGVSYGPEFTDQNGTGFHFTGYFRQMEE